MPSARKTSSKTAQNLLSRSCTKYLTRLTRLSLASLRFRAIWAHQAALAAPSVTPPMRTFRVFRSMKNNTWSVFNRTDSTVKRSQAMIDEAWARMNWRHVSRFGGGRAPDGQDPTDRSGRDLRSDLLELTLDTPVTPGRVLGGQTPDEELYFFWYPFSGADPVAEAPLGADQVSMPAPQCFGSDQR